MTSRTWKQDQDFSFSTSLDLNHNLDELFELLHTKSGTQSNLANHNFVKQQENSGGKILKGWATHYQNLGQPSNHDYDESFLHTVDEELTNMSSQSHEQPNITLNKISEEEVYNVIQSLQLGKAQTKSSLNIYATVAPLWSTISLFFLIGVSLSEPHTSVTSLHQCVCMFAWTDHLL